MNGIIGTFRIGEDLAVALDALAGDTASVGAVSAVLKPALVSANRFTIDQSAAAIALTVAPQSPPSAGWTLSLANPQTALLAPGIYAIDARLTIAGSVEITDQTAFVALSQATLA